MKINSLQITSATALLLNFEPCAPVCVLRGRYSDLALDLIRELIGDFGARENPDRIDDGVFVISADVAMDEKKYNACYIRNADYIGDNRLAVNFKPNSMEFSTDDTEEFVEKCNALDTDDSNILYGSADVKPCDDTRPIFIYDYFDRLDEATDLDPILNMLVASGRQVFVAVCRNYPIEKLTRSDVKVVDTDADHAEN